MDNVAKNMLGHFERQNFKVFGVETYFK